MPLVIDLDLLLLMLAKPHQTRPGIGNFDGDNNDTSLFFDAYHSCANFSVTAGGIAQHHDRCSHNQDETKNEKLVPNHLSKLSDTANFNWFLSFA